MTGAPGPDLTILGGLLLGLGVLAVRVSERRRARYGPPEGRPVG